MKEKPSGEEIVHGGFAALRTPLLPFDEFEKWSGDLEGPTSRAEDIEASLERDKVRLRAYLRDWLARPEIRDALFVASPNLEESLGVWLDQPESERGQKVERTLVRYFVRMTARPTPFGLFAGNSVAEVSSKTRLDIDERAGYLRHTRLDMDYLCALADALEAELGLREALVWRPNSSLYQAAGRLRYAESRLKENVRSHHLVAVEPTDYLLATLERASKGATFDDLAVALVDDEVSLEEAKEYLGELVASQILVSDLAPVITGEEPVPGLIAKLKATTAGTMAAEVLERTRIAIEKVDAEGLGAPPDVYREVAEWLEAMPAKVDLPRLYQVDMTKPAPSAVLGGALLSEITRGVKVLHRLFGAEGEVFARFRESFIARYETREVPLVEVLDEESGIGFETSVTPSAEAAPLLEGLVFPPGGKEKVEWGTRQSLLLRKLNEALEAGYDEIRLDPREIEELDILDPPPLPDAFAAMGTVAASSTEALDRGDFQVLIDGASGPSGARLLGRFCHADERLAEDVRRHLALEESQSPEAIFAEVVHLPEGRLGNILLRPLMRRWEIPYLGASGAPLSHQIPVTDLLVSIVGNRIVLRSKRLGKEVIPRLTSAHNFTFRSLGIYRFLCSLQQQGSAGSFQWHWGPLEEAPFLPRVSLGRLVFSRARWNLERKDLRRLGEKSGAACFEEVQRWRSERKLPRLVALADADNELLIDLDNVLSVESFVHTVKRRTQARLVEMFPGPGELCARGPEGRFVHEILVPFIRTREPSSFIVQPPSKDGAVIRRFPPGSEWLYAKLYTGTATADLVLREVVGPVVRQAIDQGSADGWFFIRYADPNWHIRVRIHSRQHHDQEQVWSSLTSAVLPLLEDSRIWRVQLDTYEREVERYGGKEGAELAEAIFQADSDMALEIVELLSGDEGSDARWRLALRGIDMILDGLGLDLDGKRNVMRGLRDGFANEFGSSKVLKKQLGEKFRQERQSLEQILDPAKDNESELARGFEALQRGSTRMEPLFARVRELDEAGRVSSSVPKLAASFIHMHANRILRSAQRAQEMVLYDLLDRIYLSRANRGS